MTSSNPELEKLLELAAAEPANRPEFYRALLVATVYIIGTSGVAGDGSHTLEPGAGLSLQTWQRADGAPFIPFFTSQAALQRAIQGEVRFVALPARALFETTRGTALVLNPRSKYGKEFAPAEIETLLAHGLSATPETRVVGQPTQVLLGQPKEYPSKLVASLTILLVRHRNVTAAYLALMHDPAKDPRPHLLIGIASEGEPTAAIREAGAVAQEVLVGEPVDFVEVRPGDAGLGHYLLSETQPFYERA